MACRAVGLTRRREWIVRFLVLVLALCVVESALRLLAKPATGTEPTRLLGRPLPPFDLLAGLQLAPTRYEEAAPARLQRGGNLTRGDLWGISRLDPELGHAPRESAASLAGWWQSNALGARDREETAVEIPSGRVRILAFGDSYTHGSRVSQEDTWPAQLEDLRPELDVVNFGVDGYGMAQSYLRYRGLRERVRHDGVVLVFVPSADLPRDVNVFRPLLDWRSPVSTPRFELTRRCEGSVPDASGLHRVAPYFPTVSAFASANGRHLEARFRDHLRCHDFHYRRIAYEPIPLIGGSYIARLCAAIIDSWQTRDIAMNWMEPESEAVQVERETFRAMSSQVGQGDGRFLLAYLPLIDEIERGRTEPRFRASWAAMIDATCPAAPMCLDLLAVLAAAPADAIDEGRGSHYGAATNQLIAKAIGDAVLRGGWLDSMRSAASSPQAVLR
jgi:hypothetical protein